MPTGPLNRVADNSLTKKLLGWVPKVKFIDGLHRTIGWYYSSREREKMAAMLDRMLTQRTSDVAAGSAGTEVPAE